MNKVLKDNEGKILNPNIPRYDKFKNNIPTQKSYDYNFMTLESDIIITTKTGISRLRKSAYLTKSGQVYFLEVLNRENFK